MRMRLTVVSIIVAVLSAGAQSKPLPKFDRVLLLEKTAEDSANAHIGDVNGDGNLDIVLAKGPAGIYPRTTVNGNLDYDYETGNWYTNGIRFRYNLNGKDVEDVVTGSIKWIEDPNRATNGKGHYEFNLRFNEAQTSLKVFGFSE